MGSEGSRAEAMVGAVFVGRDLNVEAAVRMVGVIALALEIALGFRVFAQCSVLVSERPLEAGLEAYGAVGSWSWFVLENPSAA